ncbi:MAG: segregation/condensation protein A [bacterium]|nr:segregation/condensation protein A [bacterium]
METEYKVRTHAFEGPLELLLELIEKKKLGINDISLAQVTDDFIAYLKSLGAVPLSYTANFIMTAASLVLVKSKSLLPSLALSSEEESNIDELKRRLLLYQLFKGVGEKLRALYGALPLMKRPYPKITPLFVPDDKLTVALLRTSMDDVFANVPQREKAPEVMLKKVLSIEEMIDTLTERVEAAMRLSFRDFSKHGKGRSRDEKVYVIVSFLAILELVKQGVVEAKQDREFDDIEIASAREQAAVQS